MTAVNNCKPILAITPVSKGGFVYQVPVPINDQAKEFKAMKIIVETCEKRDKKKQLFYERLANELIQAYANEVIYMNIMDFF